MAAKRVKKRERSSNYTVYERQVFIEIIKKYRSIVDKIGTSNFTIQDKNHAWALIDRQYNSTAKVRPRTCLQLKRLYENMKRKRNYAFFMQHLGSTINEESSCSTIDSSHEDINYLEKEEFINDTDYNLEKSVVDNSHLTEPQNATADSSANETHSEDNNLFSKSTDADIQKMQCELLKIKKENAILKQLYLKKKNQLIDQQLLEYDIEK